MFALGRTKHLTGCALPWVTPFYETPFAPLGVEVPVDAEWFYLVCAGKQLSCVQDKAHKAQKLAYSCQVKYPI